MSRKTIDRPSIHSSSRRARYRGELIDLWEMTIEPVPGTYEGTFTVKLPGSPFLAVQ